MQLYPKWKFARGDRGVIVQTAEEEAQLGEGWYDSPTLIPAEEPQDEAPVEKPEKPEEKPEKRRGRPRKGGTR